MPPLQAQTLRTVLYLDHTAKLSGGEIALLRFLQAIDRSRVCPVVVLAEEGSMVDRLKDMGIETRVLPLDTSVRNIRKDTLRGGSLTLLAAAVKLIRYSFAVSGLVREYRADIIHTNSLKSDIYGGLAGWITRTPVVWHIRDHIDTPYLPAAAAAVFRLLAKALPSFIISNSESTSRRLNGADAAAGRRQVIHDGLELSFYIPRGALAPPSCWRETVKVGLVGRLAPWKGQHVFLKAASLVSREFDVEFVVVGAPLFGESSYERHLQELAETLNIADRVAFLGFRSDVDTVLQDLDILVHASTEPEPFGQVVIEGMAAGLPVIGSDGGGVREIIEPNVNGMLVPMNDAPALARAIENLLADPSLAAKLAQAGYQHVRRNFTIAATARSIETVYDSLARSGEHFRPG